MFLFSFSLNKISQQCIYASQGRNQEGLRGLNPPPPLSQVKVEKKDNKF